MAPWQLGNDDNSRRWYDKAIEWIEENQPDDEEIDWFRDEAEALLGINENVPTKQQKSDNSDELPDQPPQPTPGDVTDADANR